ncbi:hypothetical protein Glove_58g50 [Diversispora epigaea]|uniref:Uncharacterized protein n=1 Tax=Diversispora epigaea TaxID=1348612 RepID=A0A397JL40_9GLOM|nr:hypothetical protein Glove_58g50 [Diversispora epigaea]
MSEYLNDYVVSHSEWAINSQYLPTEMHKEGLDRLFNYYPDGLERIKTVYRQEVLKIEYRNPKGRRKIEVVRTKVKDCNSKKKAVKRTMVIPEPAQPVVENLNEMPPIIKLQSK